MVCTNDALVSMLMSALTCEVSKSHEYLADDWAATGNEILTMPSRSCFYADLVLCTKGSLMSATCCLKLLQRLRVLAILWIPT